MFGVTPFGSGGFGIMPGAAVVGFPNLPMIDLSPRLARAAFPFVWTMGDNARRLYAELTTEDGELVSLAQALTVALVLKHTRSGAVISVDMDELTVLTSEVEGPPFEVSDQATGKWKGKWKVTYANGSIQYLPTNGFIGVLMLEPHDS